MMAPWIGFSHSNNIIFMCIPYFDVLARQIYYGSHACLFRDKPYSREAQRPILHPGASLLLLVVEYQL